MVKKKKKLKKILKYDRRVMSENVYISLHKHMLQTAEHILDPVYIYRIKTLELPSCTPSPVLSMFVWPLPLSFCIQNAKTLSYY